MPEKKKYPYEGRQVEGEVVGFTTLGEQWNHYQLEDGSSMKIKIVLMDVVRLDEHTQAGDPVYLFTAQQVIGVVSDPQLKKKEN